MENQDQRLGRLLLGDLPEEEQEALEIQALEDPEFFDLLLLAEDELVDAYVHGKLSTKERQQFGEGPGRSPRIRQRLEIARLLSAEAQRAIDEAVESSPREALAPGMPLNGRRLLVPLLAAALLSVVVALPFYFFSKEGNGVVEGSAKTFEIVLSSSGSRAADPLLPESIPVGTERLSIYLKLEAPVSPLAYSVAVINPSQVVLWRGEDLFARSFDWGEAVVCAPSVETLLPASSDAVELTFQLFEGDNGTVLATYSLGLQYEPTTPLRSSTPL